MPGRQENPGFRSAPPHWETAHSFCLNLEGGRVTNFLRAFGKRSNSTPTPRSSMRLRTYWRTLPSGRLAGPSLYPRLYSVKATRRGSANRPASRLVRMCQTATSSLRAITTRVLFRPSRGAKRSYSACHLGCDWAAIRATSTMAWRRSAVRVRPSLLNEKRGPASFFVHAIGG